MPTYTDYNGVYQGTGNKTGDGCNNGFSQTAPMTGTLTLNTSGTGTWVKTHTSVAVTFNFNVSATLNATGVAFNGTTTKAIGADNYSVADNGNIVKSNGKYTMTLTQVFTRLGASPCTITYSVTMVLG